jgi:hypothetical protein
MISKTVNNANALAEQEAIVKAIGEDSVCVSITTGSALGATLLAFNQIARKYGQAEMSPQELVDAELPNALTARKRAWEYSDKTRSNKAFVEEMRVIAKLFHVPASDHAEYHKRMSARFEAEQACRAKYGIQ